ncbi:MAG: four helix bundle protein [Bacteroidetes bacterium]|nr:four helix bundle protein [Bacteroidota bacterium]
MEEIKTYKDLVVWQKSIQLVKEVYRLMQQLPSDEKFALATQMKRSSVSVPSNIAEGWGRVSTKDYLRFLRTARGSLYELESQLIVCKELGFVANSEQANNLLVEVSKMLVSMINKIKARIND